mmetsp:Transcript_41613/g.120665  ORF Transcript_41613/g.120665 Transcript_41613/m.120665 type:complete len:222 (+) Transcript_41613:87-752(+)
MLDPSGMYAFATLCAMRSGSSFTLGFDDLGDLGLVVGFGNVEGRVHHGLGAVVVLSPLDGAFKVLGVALHIRIGTGVQQCQHAGLVALLGGDAQGGVALRQGECAIPTGGILALRVRVSARGEKYLDHLRMAFEGGRSDAGDVHPTRRFEVGLRSQKPLEAVGITVGGRPRQQREDLVHMAGGRSPDELRGPSQLFRRRVANSKDDMSAGGVIALPAGIDR